MDRAKLYYEMLRIRMVEERIANEYPKGKMRCPVHLSIGQEAAAVGLCAALKKDDKIVSTHRGHAHYLAKGGSLKGLIGELYGKSTGCSRGNGGSMHLIDLDCGFYGSTSIVGGTVPVGVGLAFADKIRWSGATTVICIGDAAIEEGVFHESANFASLHKLNVIFACENNLYSCYTHISKRQPNRSLERVAKAHKLSYRKCEPNNLQSIMNTTMLIRRPAFIEIPTYRYREHCGPNNDDHLGYRAKEEVQMWMDLDPLYINSYPATNVSRDEHIRIITAEIDEAFQHAEDAPPAVHMSSYAH